MLEKIIGFSIKNKLIVLLFTGSIFAFGLFALTRIPIGAVPDITNNQVQVITTSRNLSTQDVEQFITYPIELEMANLPGVKEIRSVSKFGLSVVTIVFEDRLGTYLPRQLIAEKIKSASEKIPEGFGTPEMGPISTGLGEIYQYILDTKPGYDSLYSPMDLRTIQDWIVKRQLSGLPGVVEVNTWGGYLKQYEVAVDPARLRAGNLSIAEIFSALEKNNHVAGGGYIEKLNESYFIRGEGLTTSVEDIENIVVKNEGGVPVFIRDVATVRFGHATRFGAITGNGEGEKVLGQVMMLKDANSKAVIERVKERVEEIQATLPEGVFINGFLERSELIGKTTKTVAENLILGFLIVVFVVVLLIGNLRSGMVVASVIPLCLLFAISMMYIFGIDANLMSLGAIDFGIIIDGAVIIVEFIAFQITSKSAAILALAREERQDQIDKITQRSATRMMNSAVFGQLIIMIVFIPILSLSGVEGKMFHPMALTFCFALLGAMFFCFTYVPVASALFLKPSESRKKSISDWIMKLLERSYMPVLKFSMHNKKLIIGSSFVVFFFSVFLFTRMGGEFVPTLDEGDFVIQPVLKTGTSLSKAIETTTQIEKILKEFPEVNQVVSRIGAAEVPTDPMSMEESDIIITLKPIKQWVTAKTKDELAEKFKEALSVLPGYEYEFTQPIEMRFNELITGVRADVAIKIFGDDLAVLYSKALEVKRLIAGVEGASDIIVEKVAGLPQMTVRYDRQRLARYGLNVAEVNEVITMGFAGLTAGSIFEGQKRFDLVVRLEEGSRQNLDDIKNMVVPLPGGQQLPLSELAEISYTRGPAKISRDDTKRRIVIGVNVRNRDMESVVKDVQAIIGKELKLPAGYYISYGGQYQNLRTAKQRLMLAVPVALLLIFILLHFAFKSFRDALMIYSAIPLSAVGGILFLWIRGMPFSISAGVGFIALFGIAVLNGIVLIEHLKELKEHGMEDVEERIYTGTRQRLRPVMMTAAAAALGFLPMAISTSAGAEVQRPLATVVIGGLVTSTLLTMIVLPLFYSIFDKPLKIRKKKSKLPPAAAILLLLFLPVVSLAQSKPLLPDEAVKIAVENNRSLRAASLRVRQMQQLVPAGVNPDKTGVYYNYDQNNVAENGFPIKVWGVQQSLQFPTVYAAQVKLGDSRVKLEELRFRLQELELEKELRQACQTIVVLQQKQNLLARTDSLYRIFVHAAGLRYRKGESSRLEKLTLESRQQQASVALQQIKNDIGAAYQQLSALLQSGEQYVIPGLVPEKLEAPDSVILPGLAIYQQLDHESAAALKLEQNKLLPDLELEYFQGTNRQPAAKLYQGFQIGVGIPLWFGAQKAAIRSARTEQEIRSSEKENYLAVMHGRIEQLRSELQKYRSSLDFYETTGKLTAEELIKTSTQSFQAGEIDFVQYLLGMESAAEIDLNYLDQLLQYNQTVLELNYLTR